MGDAVIFNREGTDVTAEFVDEFGAARRVAGMTSTYLWCCFPEG